MRNSEERLAMMHKRADEIRRENDLRDMKILGAVSGMLTICLIVVMHQINDMYKTISISSQMSGSSLLEDSAGAYVLIAVIAFFAGSFITAGVLYCRKHRVSNQK